MPLCRQVILNAREVRRKNGAHSCISTCAKRRTECAIREGKLVARTRAGSGIVRHTRPVGPVDFAAQNLVYDIACEASMMGAIPQAILRPQRKACSHRRPSMHDVW